jgi:hypothetical protein
MTMGIAAVLVLITLLVLVGVPGWMVYRRWLRRGGLSWRVGIAIVLAAQTVVFSSVAAVVGYGLWLMVAISVGVLAGLILLILTARHRDSGLSDHRGGTRNPDSGISLKSAPTQSAWRQIDWAAVLGHVFVFGVFFAPALVLFLPLDTDAQGFGYLALMVREGGTISTLAPWHAEVHYLYSPSLFVWWAYLSDLLGLPLHQVMLPFSHIMAGLTALLGVDLAEVLLPVRERARWLFPLMITAGMGLFLTVMDSAYTTVFAFVFVALFLVLAFRAARAPNGGQGESAGAKIEALPEGHTPAIDPPLRRGTKAGRWLIGMAAVALAAVALTHPDTIIILLIAYIPFYATFWLAKDALRTWRVWVQIFVIIPAVGVALTLPWLVRVLPLFFEAGVVSPFELSKHHVTQLVLYQGAIVPLLAVIGLVVALRRRTLADVLMITWVVALIDFSLFGVVERIGLVFGVDVMRYVYPFSVAWHGPILVYPYLATVAADTLMERVPFSVSERVRVMIPAVGVAALVTFVALTYPILRVTRPYLSFFGAFSSRADIAAMEYLRENAAEDALILNYPVGFEGHWVPVIAERETVAFRDQPFFAGAQPLYDRNTRLKEYYFDPGLPGAEEAIREAGVDYIIIPQLVADRSQFDGDIVNTLRWRWPEDTWYALQSPPAEQDWLELVFERDGAQVWRILPQQ